MGLSPADAGRMTIYDFTAMRHHWNRRHAPKDGPKDETPLPAVTEEFIREQQEAMRASGIATGGA